MLIYLRLFTRQNHMVTCGIFTLIPRTICRCLTLQKIRLTESETKSDRSRGCLQECHCGLGALERQKYAQVPVDNYVVLYILDNEDKTVNIVCIFQSSQDIIGGILE